MNRDQIAIEITTILFNLYSKLKENKKENEKVYFSPSIKDKDILKNCTPESVEFFKKVVEERDSIVKFVLSTSVVQGLDVEEEYNDKNKITVIISDDEMIKVKYQNEFVNEEFDTNDTDKTLNEELIERNKPVREQVNFGILGNYQLSRINYYDDNGYTNEEIDKKIKNIMKKFNENIDNINNQIFMKLYNVDLVGEPIWDEDFFEEIVYKDKLPENFDDLSEEEKIEVLYKIDQLTEEDFENINDNNLALFNFEKIQETAKIYNVTFEPEYKKISIEVHLLNGYMSPMIVLKYNDKFEVNRYVSGY